MLLVGRVLDVVHQRVDLHHLHVLKLRVEVLHFLTGVVDFVPAEFSRLQRLAGGHRLIQVRAGGVDFLGEQERRVDSRAGQLPGVVIGRDVQVMLLRHHLDAALAVLHVHGTFDVRAAVVLQPQIDWYCHITSPFIHVVLQAASLLAAFICPGHIVNYASGDPFICRREAARMTVCIILKSAIILRWRGGHAR